MAKMYCVWKILINKCLVMVTIIIKWSLHSNYIGNCNIPNCLPNPNSLTNLTETLNLHILVWWAFKWNIKLNFEKCDRAPLSIMTHLTLLPLAKNRPLILFFHKICTFRKIILCYTLFVCFFIFLFIIYNYL